jgi:hypothetical protein
MLKQNERIIKQKSDNLNFWKSKNVNMTTSSSPNKYDKFIISTSNSLNRTYYTEHSVDLNKKSVN